MLLKQHEIIIDNESYLANVTIPETGDLEDFISIYESWFEISELLENYGCGRVNLPEFSKLLFCLVNDCWRCNDIESISKAYNFDCYDPLTKKTIEILSTDIKEDLTFINPNINENDVYFIDLYCDIEYNGSFKIYEIPRKYIEMLKITNNNSEQNKRLVTSIKKNIIEPNNIKPIKTGNIYNLAKKLMIN